jgi:hypothetical protein
MTAGSPSLLTGGLTPTPGPQFNGVPKCLQAHGDALADGRANGDAASVEPGFPKLRRFLKFWQGNLAGPLFSVTISHSLLLNSVVYRNQIVGAGYGWVPLIQSPASHGTVSGATLTPGSLTALRWSGYILRQTPALPFPPSPYA